MSVVRFILIFGFALSVLSGAATAAGDAVVGEEVARQLCIECHNVEADGPFKLHPPSFASIAVYRSPEDIYGRILFPPLHSNMPQLGFMLTPETVENIIAYITSLEKND
ncbi:MAG: cytochrome c [Stappiaceae bacterium]